MRRKNTNQLVKKIVEYVYRKKKQQKNQNSEEVFS